MRRLGFPRLPGGSCGHRDDTARRLVSHGVGTRLARYKVSRRLVLLADLPVLPRGKVDKKRLRNDLR